MRRREKFVLASILLSLGLLSLQYVSLDWRYPFLILFSVFTYVVSAWALSDDLQKVEWLTILPMPALYAGAVGSFYFLLPDGWLSRFFDLALFGIGMDWINMINMDKFWLLAQWVFKIGSTNHVLLGQLIEQL